MWTYRNWLFGDWTQVNNGVSGCERNRRSSLLNFKMRISVGA